ncbi:MAG: S8 family serine peptidase [Armatimonadota bacterium]
MWPAAGSDGPWFVVVDRIPDVNPPRMFAEDEFIVVLTRAARRTVAVGTDPSGRPTASLPDLQDAIERSGAVRFSRQFPTAKPRAVGSRYPDLTGHYKVRIRRGADLDRAMEAFARDPHVDHVERIGIHVIDVDPNDPFYKDPPVSTFPHDQWHFFDRDSEKFSIQADLAWEIEAGGSAVVVAIADTGVRYFHLDLGGDNPVWGPDEPQTDGNIFINPGELPGNGQDDDGNGLVDDTIGYDFVANTKSYFCFCVDADCNGRDNDPDDSNGHGTHLSGTVAAITNNARLVAGIAGDLSDGTASGAGNGVKILPLRIGWYAQCFGYFTGVVRMDYAAEAMNYVAELVEAGVNVAAFNASWGSSNTGGIDAATDNLLAHDVMLIHSAGNSGADNPGYLGGKTGVMNVAATDRGGAGASFTNHGAWVDLAAPGVDILSTYRNPDDPNPDAHYIAVFSGTSMAAPHGCGVAALLESCDPTLSGPAKFDIMVTNVRAYLDPGGRDLGSGILNAKLALEAAGCGDTPCTVDADCEDADACTTDSCGAAAGCVHDPVACPAGEVCVSGLCEPQTCDEDGICEPGEDCMNCPGDCPLGNGAACGNGLCEAGDGEDCLSCPADCNGKQSSNPTGRFCCGDGEGENPLPCSDPICTSAGFGCTDDPAAPACCGDGACEGSETSASCPRDCGAPSFCGDFLCDPGEDRCTCMVDCGAPPEVEANCTDGLDADCDGLTDCNDEDCRAASACACTPVGEPCSSDSDCCSLRCRGRAKAQTCRE